MAYQKALEIRERLASINPQIYELDIAITLINMGILYGDWFEDTNNKRYVEIGLITTLKCESVLKNCINSPTVQNYNKYVIALIEYFNSVK